MKKIQSHFLALVCFALFPYFGSAQEQYSSKVSLNWLVESYSNIHNGTELQRQSFKGAAIDGRYPEVARYLHQLPLSGHGSLDVTVTAIKTESIAITGEASVSALTSNYQVSYSLDELRSDYFANISIVPIRKGKSGFEKLVEFDLDVVFTPSNALQVSTSRDGDHVSTSELSVGVIYKIAIGQEGVYQISGDFLKDVLDVDLNGIDARNIQLFGNRGGRLPFLGSADQADDVQEIPIQMRDGGDDQFDADDSFLFYAQGADRLHTDNEASEYQYDKNVYSTNNFVFLKIFGNQGQRITTIDSESSAEYLSDEFDYVQRYEDDRTNLLGAFVSTEGTGKDWFGDYFALESSKSYDNVFDISDVGTLGAGQITMRFAARGDNKTTVKLNVNSNQFSADAFGTNLTDIEADYARPVLISEQINLNESNNTIAIEYVKSTSQDEGWLDYIQLEYRKKITAKYDQIRVSDRQSLSHQLAGIKVPTGNFEVWDVTDINNTAIVRPNGEYVIYDSGDELKTFFIVKSGQYLVPENGNKIENQNLHGIDRADLVIVYHPEFVDAAERLAEHRRTHNGYQVVLVNILEVYNEFSSGRLDPTALRDFNRMLAARDPQFRYLLLLGDGSYDYRGINTNIPDHNFIPVYETDESFNPILGFPSDDYYALLGDDEGEPGLRGALDLSIGRIPVTSPEMATGVIDKIIGYDTNEDALGDWRLRIAFAADDEDTNLHVDQADNVAERMEREAPVYNQSKIFFDSYLQESTPGGDRYPGATEAINNTVNNGALILNYMGHGGPKGWSQERVLKVSDIETWTNREQLPLLITATCSFTGYDDPSIVSAGEEAMQKANGGVVGLFTTVRAVYASANKRLVDAVFDVIFEKVDGQPQTFGDIITRAKNQSADSQGVTNDRKFSLIGDPSQQIAIPTYNIVTTSVNGTPISELDTISALEQVTIRGSVTDEFGEIVSDFNGTIFPTIFDKESMLETLKNDTKSRVKEFGVYRNVLFKGSATVTNGKFEFTFVVPQDINYEFGSGRISYYAHDGLRDAAGNFNDLIVGGTDPNAVADDEGPEMQLFMNDQSFVFGGSTNDSPTLLVLLSDDLGINVSGTSIGHDITAVIDEDTRNSVVLNDFYEANINDYTSGTVRFPLKDLEEGKHTITVKAWDVSNNSTEQLIEFVVVNGEGTTIENVYNYPNPFTTNTKFMFEHDLVGKDLDVLIDIYTVSGRLVRTIEHVEFSSAMRVDNIYWDAKDDFQSGLAKGLYLYKIRIKDQNSNQSRESGFQKMVRI